MQAFGRYKITRPTEEISVDGQNRPNYHFSVGVIDDRTGELLREFAASEVDGVRAAFRAVDEMLDWLKDAEG